MTSAQIVVPSDLHSVLPTFTSVHSTRLKKPVTIRRLTGVCPLWPIGVKEAPDPNKRLILLMEDDPNLVIPTHPMDDRRQQTLIAFLLYAVCATDARLRGFQPGEPIEVTLGEPLAPCSDTAARALVQQLANGSLRRAQEIALKIGDKDGVNGIINKQTKADLHRQDCGACKRLYDLYDDFKNNRIRRVQRPLADFLRPHHPSSLRAAQA